MVNKKLYPFDGHRLDLDGLSYHYLDEGQGDTVVMVHGNPTWSFYYRNLVQTLSDRYRCIVPDHIGCGLSDKPGDDRYEYTLERRVDDLDALLDHLHLKENITLVVHDWGGMIGMALASRYPERIKRLVVMNTAAFHLPKAKTFPLALTLGRTPIGSFLIRGFNAFSGIAARICCKRNPLSAELKQAYTEPYNSWANRIATLRFVQDIPLKPGDRAYNIVQNVQDGLQRFAQTPLLICWGVKDFVFSTEFLDEWVRHLPHAEVHRFEDGGHYILEDAAKEVIPLIDDFLAKHPIHQSAGV